MPFLHPLGVIGPVYDGGNTGGGAPSGGANLGWKAPVRAATLTATNITLAGGAPNTLDGVTLVAADRILVKDQTAPAQNGIYYVATLGTGANGTWTRAADMAATGDVVGMTTVAVQEGTDNVDTYWYVTTDGLISLGVTSMLWEQLGPRLYVQRGIGASMARVQRIPQGAR